MAEQKRGPNWPIFADVIGGCNINWFLYRVTATQPGKLPPCAPNCMTGSKSTDLATGIKITIEVKDSEKVVKMY